LSAAVPARYPTQPGSHHPPGATVLDGGINFAVFSRHATRIELLLYERADSLEAFQTIVLDPDGNRTHMMWHVFVEGLTAGAHYAWRADGPDDTALTGRRFNARKELLDPWARGVTDCLWNRARASDPRDARPGGMRAVVTEAHFDWGSERAPAASLEGAVIYEAHVGGFTRHPSCKSAAPRGTFAALSEHIPYLKELGVTHVELLPVMAFDEQSVPPNVAARGLKNYWGYNTHSFWSPHPRYCIAPETGRQTAEFKQLVRSLHQAGLGVILDVVYNHTAEGGDGGPWINFKGIANEIAYHLDPRDRRRYLDFTGCGNTLNCNHPQITAFIVHSLEYWVEEMHVDGFRFDLASVFARGDLGTVLPNPPLPWDIELSPKLAEVPLIAEAWDAAGLYQLGAFPGLSWVEWNGAFRDDIRRFVRGDPALTRAVATRVGGSSDLYDHDGRLPCNSINFITCHDGFTLADLVSYDGKHNEANGEDNRDGSDNNLSWNCGTEGETSNPTILALRLRQAKNFIAILMLARGVPMLRSGDEVLHTQRGNNNVYCQDNELSWFDWRRLESQQDMLRFTREMIAFRRRHPSLTRNRFYNGQVIAGRDAPDIAWHGTRLGEPPWNDSAARFLAFTVSGLAADEPGIHALLNMSDANADTQIPPAGPKRWHVAVNTAAASPADISNGSQEVVREAVLRVSPRSVVVLEAR
jgi:isoamylase